MTLPTLPDGRLEERLTDHKPRYSAAEAKAEADRCLYCADAPCIQACPTEIDIPTFIKKIASGNVTGAARTILSQNVLGVSCARVCPVEVLCVGKCVYTAWHRDPIPIGRLQRYATETAIEAGAKLLSSTKAKRVRRVALVGAGPASLACAAELALAGHQATIYEARPVPGGLNTTGIAPYKLQADESIDEVEWVQSLGVEIKVGARIGPGALRGEKLLAEHDAVFIGVGLGADTRLGIAGEEGPGVHGATAWIEGLKLSAAPAPKLGQVVVIGGGNTALDCARETALLGAERVTLIYRRGPEEMSGYAHEVEAARTEGVEVLFHTLPAAFVRDASGALRGLLIAKAHGGKPAVGTETELPCTMALVAIGQSKLHALVSEFSGVAVDGRGCIVADPKICVTGNPKVFSGGDCINGGKEVVNAVADGRNAARELLRRWGIEQ